ncbi:hypothetical protein JCM11491_000293 [Sporobolomyces phaffii]
MPSQTPGECVVCGQSTFKRCGACSSVGLDWMCFCSTAHQKLVWKGHKRICGKAGTFSWPELDDEELVFAGEELLEAVEKSRKAVNPSKAEQSQHHRDLAKLRKGIMSRRTSRIVASPTSSLVDVTETLKADLIGTLIGWEGHRWPQLCSEKDFAPFSSELQHRLLILFSLLQRSVEMRPLSGDRLGEMIRLCVVAFDKIRDVCKRDVLHTYPRQGYELVEEAHQLMSAVFMRARS